MRGLVITGTGWTSAELDQTPLPVVWDLLKHWLEFPPSHVLLRAHVGWKGPEDREPGEPFDVSGLVQAMGDVPTTRTVPDHIREHIEEMRRANAGSN